MKHFPMQLGASVRNRLSRARFICLTIISRLDYEWRVRRENEKLLRFDEYLLNDIGMTRADVEYELRKQSGIRYWRRLLLQCAKDLRDLHDRPEK